MDIGSAFTYMFDDEDWIKKILIGGVATLLGIVIVPLFLVTGYMLQTLKNVRDQQPRPLPEWDDYGTLLTKGLMLFLISLVYMLPILLLACVSGVMNGFAPQMDQDMAEVVVIIAGCLSCVQGLLGLVIGLILPAAIIRYAEYDTFGSAFQFGAIFSFISNNLGDYIIVVLIGWVAQFIASFGVLLLCIGVFFTSFWSVLVMGHLYGQLARKAALPTA